MNKFGNLIFSVGEQEIIESLQVHFNQSLFQAIDHVVKQKREASVLWRRQGLTELADQLLKEIGELK
jgi:uncharacterized protein YqeY